MDNSPWLLTEDRFDPARQHHQETIFNIGNGYLSTRGAFEEGYPGDRRATFIHGVFDAAPIVYTELANASDWLPFTVLLDGERFSLADGTLESYRRALDLRTGLLERTVRWRSPSGHCATLTFQRFASLADPHTLFIRCRVIPEFAGALEFRLALNGNTDNEGLVHWRWLGQGRRDGAVFLHNRTRVSQIDVACAMRLEVPEGQVVSEAFWDVENTPTLASAFRAAPGQAVTVDKFVAIATSRDTYGDTSGPVELALERVQAARSFPAALQANARAWEQEWERADVVIEGDEEAQISLRFNLFQLLVAAPRGDDRVNIGAKTLSGFGYRGHCFWDTEVFMLPVFIYTAPHIARNLLNYRCRNLPGARQKARLNGFEGAQFPWESAGTGEEVTPAWVPYWADPTKLVRIWTGDIEIHISADIAYAAHRYWQVTGDDEWLIDKGAELILDTARFWATRAEWDPEKGCYEYNDVIGPDENHEHVDNNAYTNRMAQWNLQTALDLLDWLKTRAPAKAGELTEKLDLTPQRLERWRDVIARIFLAVEPSGLIEQFEDYFALKDVDLAALEPRDRSVQTIFGIEGANQIQVIKQPDVLMLLNLLRPHYSAETLRINYDYYTPRTDLTFGSSLGPSIQAILDCEMGRPDVAYEHFILSARADLRDVRGNAGDGIHGASAGGTWQAVVFGFAGLKITPEGWTTEPRLPSHWKRVKFSFYYRGEKQEVEIKRDA
jgi:kojibiose phosphorylase